MESIFHKPWFQLVKKIQRIFYANSNIMGSVFPGFAEDFTQAEFPQTSIGDSPWKSRQSNHSEITNLNHQIIHKSILTALF